MALSGRGVELLVLLALVAGCGSFKRVSRGPNDEGAPSGDASAGTDSAALTKEYDAPVDLGGKDSPVLLGDAAYDRPLLGGTGGGNDADAAVGGSGGLDGKGGAGGAAGTRVLKLIEGDIDEVDLATQCVGSICITGGITP